VVVVCLLAVAWAGLVAGCGGTPDRATAPTAPDPAGLRVVSYNINWGSPAPERVVAFLRETGADIVCLQETHAPWEILLTGQLGAMYPHRKFVSSGGAGGIALLSRHPLREVRTLEAGAGWFPALRAEVDTPSGMVQVLNVHLRPPLSDRGSATPSAMYQAPKIHRAEMVGFLAAMDRTAPLLIAGDFNEEEGDGAVRELIDGGFVDALSLFDRQARTWEWSLVSGVSVRRRYDHILFNAPLRCVGARVGEVQASDHYPVVAVFEWVRQP
jgi:endonuclease/exonuclease/phosphatase family metal-dependent hydrolase